MKRKGAKGLRGEPKRKRTKRTEKKASGSGRSLKERSSTRDEGGVGRGQRPGGVADRRGTTDKPSEKAAREYDAS